MIDSYTIEESYTMEKSHTLIKSEARNDMKDNGSKADILGKSFLTNKDSIREELLSEAFNT